MEEDPFVTEFEDQNFLNYKNIKDVKWDEIVHCSKKTKLCWEIAVETINQESKLIKELKHTIKALELKVLKLDTEIEILRKRDITSESSIQQLV